MNNLVETQIVDKKSNQKIIIILGIITILMISGVLLYSKLTSKKDNNSSLEQTSSSSSDIISSSVVETKRTNLHYDYYEDVKKTYDEYLNPVFKDITSDDNNKINSSGELVIKSYNYDTDTYESYIIDKTYVGNSNVISFIDITYEGDPNFIILNVNHELYNLTYDAGSEIITSTKIKTNGEALGIKLLYFIADNGLGCEGVQSIITKVSNKIYKVDTYENKLEEYTVNDQAIISLRGCALIAPISVNKNYYLKYYKVIYNGDALDYDDVDHDTYNYNTKENIKVKYIMNSYKQDDYSDLKAYIISDDNKLYIVDNDTNFIKGIKSEGTVINYNKTDNKVDMMLDNGERIILINE